MFRSVKDTTSLLQGQLLNIYLGNFLEKSSFIEFIRELWRLANPPKSRVSLGPLACTPNDLLRVADSFTAPADPPIDSKTWGDLEMWVVIRRVFANCSPVGQQVAHALLRCGAEPVLACSPISLFAQCNALRETSLDDQSVALLKLLRESDADIGGILFCDDLYRLPEWSKYLFVIPIIAIISLISLKFSWLALFPFLAAGIAIFAVQIKLYMPMMAWHSQQEAILRILEFGAKWQHFAGIDIEPCSLTTRNQLLVLQKEFRRGVGKIEWLSEYLNVLVLHQYRQFYRQTKLLRDNISTIRVVYLGVGAAESSCDLALFTRGGAWCSAAHAHDSRLKFEDLSNPLLDNPISVESVEISSRGLFLTGQNAAGKSTLLRSIGISCLFALGFGCCFARTARLRHGLVATSINAVDSVKEGHSLYVAELKRARELIDISRQHPDSIIIIDELFRGTNYLESVAAAGATIRAIGNKSFVIAASHNLVLARILGDIIQPKCVLRAASSIQLQDGVLAETNGLRLFDDFVADSEVSRHAARLHKALVDESIESRRLPGDGSFEFGTHYQTDPA